MHIIYASIFLQPQVRLEVPKVKKGNLWALSVFRLNQMLNHHVGRQPPEICVFITFSGKIVKMLVKYQYLESFRKIFRNRTVILELK